MLRLYPFTGGEIFSETTSLNVFGLYLYSCEHAVLLQMQKKKPSLHQLASPLVDMGKLGPTQLTFSSIDSTCGHSVCVRQSTMNCTPDIQSVTQVQLTRGARCSWSGYDC